MLAFITSLRHPKTAKSWSHNLKLLERTLRSVCAQSDQNFRVLVVCNEKPDLCFDHPNIGFLPVDLPPPVDSFDQLIRNADAIRNDRGRKYLAGLYHFREANPSHVMFFDADDCISNRLVETVLAGPPNTSWYVGDGYLYSEGSSLIYRIDSVFNQTCGTCHIFSYRIFDLPEDRTTISDEWIRQTLGSHINVKAFLQEKNVTLQKIPYRGAVYIINTGENQWGLGGYLDFFRGSRLPSLVRLGLALPGFRLLTSAVRKEFSLYPIQ